MAWRSQRMPLFALGIGVLLASAALPTSHASACTTTPTIPYGSFPDGCEGQDSVSGTCDDGYTGVISAACEGSVWVYAGTCTPVQHNYCTGQPTAPYASFPDNCDGQDSVTGACYGGYEGVVTATCQNGVWAYAGVCTPVQHNYCTGKPTVPYGSFPDNCDGQDSVTGTCDDGYEGVISASCENGVWVIAGVCTPVQHNYCTGKPVVQYGVFPDNCEGKDYVKGQCWLGYTGSISATCCSGQWVVEGECTQVDYPKCTGTPQYDYGYFPDNCDGKDRVDGCCNDGYEGDLYATCEYGGWVIHSSCKKSQPPPDTCYGTPEYDYGYFPDNCDGNYVDGYCNDGYDGHIYAKCIMGVWRIYGECKPHCPYNCQGKPPHVDGIYWPGSSSNKHYAKACCKPGHKQGYVEAKCECGTWVIYGTCERSEGCYGTPECQPYAKNWSWSKCNGKSECYTKCNGGCGGGGYHAYCVSGKWQVTGSCQPKRPSFRGPKHY